MRPLTLMILAVVVVQAVISLIIFFSLEKWSDRAHFGSMFGGVSALFSGLAFAGVVYTLHFQRKAFELSHSEFKHALKRQRASYLRIDLSVRSLVHRGKKVYPYKNRVIIFGTLSSLCGYFHRRVPCPVTIKKHVPYPSA